MKKLIFTIIIVGSMFSCSKKSAIKSGLDGVWELYVPGENWVDDQSLSVEFTKNKAIWTQTRGEYLWDANTNQYDTTIITTTYEDTYELEEKGHNIRFSNEDHYADGDALLSVSVGDNYIHISGNIGTGCEGCYNKVTYWGERLD